MAKAFQCRSLRIFIPSCASLPLQCSSDSFHQPKLNIQASIPKPYLTYPDFLNEFISSSFLLLFFPSKPSLQPISHSMATMKPKVPKYFNLKLLLQGLVRLFLILLLLRSNSTSPAPPIKVAKLAHQMHYQQLHAQRRTKKAVRGGCFFTNCNRLSPCFCQSVHQ